MRCKIPNCGARAFWFVEHRQGRQIWVCADCGDELTADDDWETVKSIHDDLGQWTAGP